ncbi:hypothetical protein RRG08_045237 [Elysia crispata]|uniref:Uncharacterized protein n=1 Tax=Elysia crispata TaxID=231223 RepID=A0AAE1DQM8_9GAST|nr:hypothetical protein RRG08_045237 [Elysia crispata]
MCPDDQLLASCFVEDTVGEVSQDVCREMNPVSATWWSSCCPTEPLELKLMSATWWSSCCPTEPDKLWLVGGVDQLSGRHS